METWKEFEANELTHSAAHHLLAIYEVGLAYGGWARVSDVARELDITRGSVSIALRTLKRRGLVETDEHHMVRLSDRGLKAAQAVMAKRVVVKTFLSEVLGTPVQQADIDSCKIEHLISDATGERLARFTRLLTSDDPVARAFLARFHGSHGACPDTGTCDVCKGHCFAAELARAI
jgi:DtxR family Mn-dependent transcriptional regulator